MVDCVTLWLEMHGFRRALTMLDFGADAYMRFMIRGLILAIGFQVLHLGFTLILPRTT